MFIELIKDYILLATGAAIGLLVGGLCHAAAKADRQYEKWEEKG